MVSCNEYRVVGTDAAWDFLVKQLLNQCFCLFLMLNVCLVIRVISVFIALVTSSVITVMILFNRSSPFSSINVKINQCIRAWQTTLHMPRSGASEAKCP